MKSRYGVRAAGVRTCMRSLLTLILCLRFTSVVADPAVPVSVVGSVTKVEKRESGGSLLTVDKGNNDGVERTFLGCLLLDDGHCAADARLIRIDKATSVVVVDINPDRMRVGLKVRLSSP